MSARTTYGVDVGSVRTGRLGWARVTDVAYEAHQGTAAADGLREALRLDCAGGAAVSIGFEAPLFLPLRDRAVELTRARATWEHSSFAGGLGASVLVTGLVQVAWALREVGRPVTTDPANRDDPGCLLVWEAFVSGRATDELSVPACPGGDHGPHACDALVVALEAHRWLDGEDLVHGAMRRTSSFRVEDGDHGMDLVRAVLGESALVDDVAGWDALVLQLPKPKHVVTG